MRRIFVTLLIASLGAAHVALDARQAAAKISEGTIEGADGVRLFYRKIGDAAQTVILLHGGPGSNMNGVWPDLQPLGHGRTVVVYDQRGGGRSQIIKDKSQLTAAHHVRDLEALRQRLGIERFTLAGESWGSGLAVLYAAQHPARVERLLLIGPMPPSRAIMNQRLDESSETMGLRRRLAEMVERMPASPDPIATCREFFDVYTKQFFADPAAQQRRRGSSCDGPPEGVRNYFVVNDATFASLGDFDFRPLLATLTMPALVIEGDKSIPSTIESARVFAQSLPNAALALIEGAGHYPQVERPEVFFPIVNRFLDGKAVEQAGTKAPSRAAIVGAAADIIQKAHYCTLITIGEDGQPQARIVDPVAPDAAFTMWIATNPLTRKVDQIRRNPRVTLSCFDSATTSYVTVLGRGELVTDAAEKQRHWKKDWSAFYPKGPSGNDVVLIRLTPSRLEIVSDSRGMIGDPKTWRPLSIDFPRK